MSEFYNTQELEKQLRGRHRLEPGCTWYLARYDDGKYLCTDRPPKNYDHVKRVFYSANNERFAERVDGMWVERPTVLERRWPVVSELRRAIDSLAEALESAQSISLNDEMREVLEFRMSSARAILRQEYNKEVERAVKDAMRKEDAERLPGNLGMSSLRAG